MHDRYWPGPSTDIFRHEGFVALHALSGRVQCGSSVSPVDESAGRSMANRREISRICAGLQPREESDLDSWRIRQFVGFLGQKIMLDSVTLKWTSFSRRSALDCLC